MNYIFLITAVDTPCEKTYSVFQRIFDSERLEKRPLFPEIKHRLSLLGELTARAVLSESRGAVMADLDREKTEHGKPYFKDFEDFCFNISHSGNCVAVAVADNEIGIDIEKLGEPRFDVIERFNEKEKNYILQNSADKVKRFYEIWTKKEAFLKQSGKGISVSLSKFDVTEAVHEKHFYSFTENGFYISVFSESAETEFKVIKLTETELLDLISQNRLVKAMEN